MEILLANGCRLAEPGEFTKRAYLNGRINLLEAESVNDLIIAKTDAARTLAINNVDGKLTKQISTLREKIAKILANIEVNIDYPEYTDELEVTEDLMHGYLDEINNELEKLVSGAKSGRLIKNGVNVAIIGKPNVGKSSILNALLDEETRKALYKKQKLSGTIVKGKKIGRNDPCPCGSGKKYKQCCGKNA